MSNRKHTRTLSRYLAPTLLAGALLFPAAMQATPYATALTNHGTGNSIAFRLNESGIVTVISTNLSGTTNTFALGNRTAGLINYTNAANFPGDFSVTVTKTNTPGYISGVNIQISVDGTNANISTNSLRFNSPRGVAINKNPASPYFGRIYVANSFAGSATRAVGDGIYLLNADFSDAVGQGTNARTAGIATFTNTVAADDPNTPYRLEVGEDSNLYISDTSTNSGTIYVTDPNVLTGTNLIAGFGIPGDPNSLAPSPNHGRISSSVIAKGSTNTGNLVVYAIDNDNTTTSDFKQNHIMKWDIGAGPLPADPTVGVALTNIDESTLLAVTGINTDLALGPDGKFYTQQYRNFDDGTGGLFVVDPAVDGNANGLADKVYDSGLESAALGSATDLFYQTRGVAISPDGRYMGLLRQDNQIYIVTLTNGIPDLTTRRLLAQGTTTTLGRDIAFDAAGNLYIVSSGQALMRVFSPGYITVATTSLAGSFGVTNITPNQIVLISGSAASGAATNAMEGSLNGSVNFSRTGDLGTPLTVSYALSGTATRGLDYVTNSTFGALATNTITFGAGVSSTNISLVVSNDLLGEVSETVLFTLLSSSNYVSANNLPTTVVIDDNEARITLSATQPNAAEPSTDGEMTVSRTGGDTTQPLTVSYVISGNATRGTDYATNVPGIGPAATNTITLLSDITSTNVVIDVVDNDIGEPTETVIFTLIQAGLSNYISANNLPATNFIADDGDLPNVNITARGLGSYELIPYRPAKFVVSLPSAAASDIAVNLSLTGTAVSGVDYSNPATFTVTIPAGSLSTMATVAPLDNGTIAPDKTIVCNVDPGPGYTNIGNITATNTLRNDDLAAAPVLFSEDFDIDHTSSWLVRSNGSDVTYDFFFDYSTAGIPVAPSTVGGTTRGLKLKVHSVFPVINTRYGISVSPSNQAFGGNYRLRFDAWFNNDGQLNGINQVGTTEWFFAGVGADGNKTNGPFAAANSMGPAVSFGYTPDGGQGIASTLRDMNALTNTVPLEGLPGGVYLAGTNTSARDNAAAYYAEFGDLAAPAAQLTLWPGQAGTNAAGMMGMSWHDVIINKTSTNVTWYVDGLLIANVPTTALTPLMSSNIFFAYDDANTGSGATNNPAAQFALVDNVRVEQLPASTNANLASLAITPAGALNPAFGANQTSYAATNAYTSSVTVTATRADPGATLQLSLNGGAFTPLTSGVASSPQALSLNPPTNTLVVRVTAMDTVTVKDYTVNQFLQPSATVPVLTNTVSGATLTFNWAADHIGYSLQAQTNALSNGLSPTWFTVPNTTSTNTVTITVDPSNPTVFYRLFYAFP